MMIPAFSDLIDFYKAVHPHLLQGFSLPVIVGIIALLMSKTKEIESAGGHPPRLWRLGLIISARWIRRRRYALASNLLLVGIIYSSFLAYVEKSNELKSATTSKERHIKPEERRKLVENLEKIAHSLPTIIVYADSERNNMLYAVEFLDLLDDLHVKRWPGPPNQVTSAPNERDVMIGIIDMDKPSEAAKSFASAFRKAGFAAPFVRWGGKYHVPTRPENVDFNLYIGPPS
jgi:hypothetical protein